METSRKRKRDEPFGQVRSKHRRVVEEQSICSGYRCYGDMVPVALLQEIEKFDKLYHISSILGFSITSRFLLSKRMDIHEYDPVELVETRSLDQFKAQDRLEQAKFGNNAKEVVAKLQKEIEQEGFREPLQILFDATLSKCIVDEGNTR